MIVLFFFFLPKKNETNGNETVIKILLDIYLFSVLSCSTIKRLGTFQI